MVTKFWFCTGHGFLWFRFLWVRIRMNPHTFQLLITAFLSSFRRRNCYPFIEQQSRKCWAHHRNSHPPRGRSDPTHRLYAGVHTDNVSLTSCLVIQLLTFPRLASCFPNQHLAHRGIILVRILFTIAAICLIAGGSLDGNYKSANSSAIGQKLVKAGYILFASILGMESTFLVYLWSRRKRLTSTSMIVSETYFLSYQKNSTDFELLIDSQSNLFRNTLPRRSHCLCLTLGLRELSGFKMGYDIWFCHRLCAYGPSHGVYCGLLVPLHWYHNSTKPALQGWTRGGCQSRRWRSGIWQGSDWQLVNEINIGRIDWMEELWRVCLYSDWEYHRSLCFCCIMYIQWFSWHCNSIGSIRELFFVQIRNDTEVPSHIWVLPCLKSSQDLTDDGLATWSKGT